MPDDQPFPPSNVTASGAVAVWPRLLGIDVLRGIAASLVFLIHFVGYLNTGGDPAQSWEKIVAVPIFLGSIGTNLLLLLCGFMISRSLTKPRFHYWGFLQDRVIRIYLPYCLVIALALLFWRVFPAFAKVSPHSIDLPYVIKQFVFIPGLFPGHPVLTVSWTLSIIFPAYCLCPLIAIAYRRLFCLATGSLLSLWLLLLLLCLSCALCWPAIPVRICYIPLGCAVAEWFLAARPSTLSRRRILLLLLAAALALLFRYWLSENRLLLNLPYREYTLLYWSFGAAATTIGTSLAVLTSPDHSRRWFQLPLLGLLLLGQRGYSFYLLHGPITKIGTLYLGWLCTGAASAVALALFCFSCSLLAAHLMFLFVEIRLAGCIRSMLPSSHTTASLSLLSQPTG